MPCVHVECVGGFLERPVPASSAAQLASRVNWEMGRACGPLEEDLSFYRGATLRCQLSCQQMPMLPNHRRLKTFSAAFKIRCTCCACPMSYRKNGHGQSAQFERSSTTSTTISLSRFHCRSETAFWSNCNCLMSTHK